MLGPALVVVVIAGAAGAVVVTPESSVTPPRDLAGFRALPVDPPPAELTKGEHYWVSNEHRPDLFRQALVDAGAGGVYVGVGAEQNYVLAGWQRPDVVVLMDFDGTVPQLHRLYGEVFRRAKTRKAFLSLWEEQKYWAVRRAVLDASLAAGDDAGVHKELRLVVNNCRGWVQKRLLALEAEMRKRKVKTFLTDDEHYAWVRQLWLDGRVFAVRGDLTGPSTMKAIGEAAERAGLSVKTLYMSNAEQYFDYDDGFRENIGALPFDAAGVVVRTSGWGKLGWYPGSNHYHHNVQTGVSFQMWLTEPTTTNVSVVLRSSHVHTKGYSTLSAPPTARPPLVNREKSATTLVSTTPTAAAPATATPAVIECGSDVEGMSCIPGGAFLRGSDKGIESARPQASVWLQTFWMDKHEVTVAEYKACVADGKCAKAGPHYSDFSAPRQPITGVSWFHAKQYCEARGKRLPTEAQWEKAARGVDGRRYPWGDGAASCKLAVYEDARGRSCGEKQKGTVKNADVGRPEPVGSRPANQYGLFDMAGNSWEWVADWHSPSYAECGAACAGPDPKGPCGGAEPCEGHTQRVVRGGSWYWPASHMTTFHRRAHEPANAPQFHHFGFRCAAVADDVSKLRSR